MLCAFRRYYTSNVANLDHDYINLSEKLREQFSNALLNAGNSASGYYKTSTSYATGNTGNGVACTTECRFSPRFTVRSQQEIDSIARDMTNQIVSELRSGKIVRSQLNQPSWFESRVNEQLNQVIHEHQTEFERNQQAAANRFRQQQSQTHDQWANVQQVQQPIFSQSQQQHQNNFFQQQSQSQHNVGYVQPAVTGNSFQNVVRQHHRTHSHNAAIPTTVTIVNGPSILDENCTLETGAVYPTFPTHNVHNQFHRVQTNRQSNNGGAVFVQPSGGGSTFQQTTTIHRTQNQVPQRPIVIPSQNTYHREINEEHREVHRQQPPIVAIPTQNTFREINEEHREVHRHQPPVVTIPTQNTYREVNEEHREVHRQQPPIITVPTRNTFREVHEEHREVHRQQPTVVTIPAQNTFRHDFEEEHREVHRQQPRPVVVPVTHTQTEHRETFTHDESDETVPNYRPRVVIDANTEFEELEVQSHHRPVVQPTITTHTVTKEEEQIDRHTHQRPVVVQFPQQTIVQENVEEQVQTSHHTQPQYPVFTHHTETHVVNQTHEDHGHTVITRPSGGGHTTTTIEETHFVHTLPQPANQYTIQYNEHEYLERLNRIQQELQRLGYGQLTEDEYNVTISGGGFIHNGYKYLYNADRGRYEKTERVEITEDEYLTQLRRLQNQLRQIGWESFTEEDYNATINNGFFDRGGVRYIYDSENGHYYREQMGEHQYLELRHNIQEEVQRIGGIELNASELNQTIATGHIIINGYNYVVNTHTGHLEKGNRVEISEQEYRTILRRLQEQLQRLGFDQMTETEYNQTISTGYFARGGNKYRYNSAIGVYEKVELTDEEYNQIYTKLQDTLKHLRYRQMSQKEINETISSGTFIRGGYQWTYDAQTGEVNAVRTTRPNEELSESEYRAIYNHLQQLITRLGYPRFTDAEVNQIIASGSFVKGGTEWIYQPQTGEFVRVELSEEERTFRLNRLTEILARLNLNYDESRKYEIVANGNFHYGGRRYEYDQASRQFVLVQMTDAEYRERVRQLLDLLHRIGYGSMSESECRATINSGVFYYGGHEWIYNHATAEYEMGRTTDKENGIIDDNYFSNIDFDRTHYTSTKNDTGNNETAFNIDKGNGNQGEKRPVEVISKDRGDQPPHVFIGDYEDSEELEEEPNIGVYRPPPPSTTPTPVYREIQQTLAPYTSESDRRIYEKQQTQTIFPVPTPTEESYEHRYHRKQTTFSQSAGVVRELYPLHFGF